MNSELEEQQTIVRELKEQLQLMEKDEKELTEKVKLLETKLVVQDLRAKIKAKRDTITRLRNRATELEEKLKSTTPTTIEEQIQPMPTPVEEQIQPTPPQEEAPRQFF